MNDLEKRNDVALRDWSHLVADVAHQPPKEAYGYEAALWAAGVKVLGFEQFGSYQGEWWAKIEFPDHQVGFVNGGYGSCSGCDAFEAEFGYSSDDDPGYLHKLKDFGRDYLTNVSTYEQAVAAAAENSEWDSEAPKMVEWIEQQGNAPASSH